MLETWRPREKPGLEVLSGLYARLEPLSWRDHGVGLAGVLTGPENYDIWAYMPIGPFDDRSAFEAGFQAAAENGAWATLVIRSTETQDILGMASYMRIREAHGSAEVGCVAFGHALQRTRIATEAMYLMANHVFSDLGYRRYEWKCNAENAASRRAAERFGFRFEGVFRQDMVIKGKNRDTVWYSMLDSEWPLHETAFQRWLEPINFDLDGLQKQSLADFRG